jgi:fructoselysine-6-P-deglycase FrlB-like protein
VSEVREVRNVAREIESQPACWRRAAEVAAGAGAAALPRPGERVAVAGCGTSLFIAQSYAARREAAGSGETDAFAASEMPTGRAYERVVALSRSGTTTEVLDLLGRLGDAAPTVVITADAEAPAARAAGAAVVLDFADERSVVQTRFATSALALLRAHLGEDVEPVAAQAEAALAAPLPPGALERTQFTFLGRGWTVGLGQEAALKLREAALAWAEAYPAMEYRHGPISIADERSLVWILGEPPEGLTGDLRATGALVVAEPGADPQAEVVRAQRLAVALAEARGLDPDRPRHLTRAVVLPSAEGGR